MPKSKVARRVGDKLTGSWRFKAETVAKSWASSSDALDRLIGEEILDLLDEYGDDPDWLDWKTYGPNTLGHVVDFVYERISRVAHERLSDWVVDVRERK